MEDDSLFNFSPNNQLLLMQVNYHLKNPASPEEIVGTLGAPGKKVQLQIQIQSNLTMQTT